MGSPLGGSGAPPTATQAEMEAGTEVDLRSVSPLLVAQAIAALVVSSSIISTTYTAVDDDDLKVDTSAAAFSITLPASPTKGDRVKFIDAANNFATDNLTVLRNSETIMGLAEDMTVDTDDSKWTMIYSGTDWRVMA